MHCNQLHCTALLSPALCCTSLHCTALHCIALRCTAMNYTPLHCIALHCTALHYAALHYNALHCMFSRNSTLSRQQKGEIRGTTLTPPRLGKKQFFCELWNFGSTDLAVGETRKLWQTKNRDKTTLIIYLTQMHFSPFWEVPNDIKGYLHTFYIFCIIYRIWRLGCPHLNTIRPCKLLFGTVMYGYHTNQNPEEGIYSWSFEAGHRTFGINGKWPNLR